MRALAVSVCAVCVVLGLAVTRAGELAGAAVRVMAVAGLTLAGVCVVVTGCVLALRRPVRWEDEPRRVVTVVPDRRALPPAEADRRVARPPFRAGPPPGWRG